MNEDEMVHKNQQDYLRESGHGVAAIGTLELADRPGHKDSIAVEGQEEASLEH